MFALDDFLNALVFASGYNAALVAIGASLLGAAGGAVGTFILFRRRSLVSDAVSHATLPGVGLAFVVMALLGGDGRFLPGLLIGAAASAWLGLLAIEWMTRRTRLSEDAAIGAVLSVFFGLGIVLLTVIQTLSVGRQAGLGGFLLGSTAGMLFDEAVTIAVAAAGVAALIFAMRRPMVLVAFDTESAAAQGIDVRRTDLTMMALALLVAVVGLKIVGLVLIVALMIIPPVAARFWTERAEVMAPLSALIGAVAAHTGVAISAAGDDLPTGALIVLVAFALFLFSIALSPTRGLVASALRFRRFQARVHRRQGLIALARGEPIYDRLTLTILRRENCIRADGVATLDGRAAAAAALRDEARWDLARRLDPEESLSGRYDGVTPIEDVMTADEIRELDRQLEESAEVAP